MKQPAPIGAGFILNLNHLTFLLITGIVEGWPTPLFTIDEELGLSSGFFYQSPQFDIRGPLVWTDDEQAEKTAIRRDS